MKLVFAVIALVVVGCGAIKDADHQVNKMTDHGGRGAPAADGGTSPKSSDAGSDGGVTSM